MQTDSIKYTEIVKKKKNMTCIQKTNQTKNTIYRK